MTDERPLLDTIADMTAASVARVALEDRELMLVRIAGLIAVDAPPASYLLNLLPAADSGLSLEDVQSILVALAPIIGGPRAIDAAATIAAALGYAVAIEDALEEEDAMADDET